MKIIKNFLTEEEQKKAFEYLPDQAQVLLNSDDWYAFLDAINDVIIDDIYEHNNEITAYGIEAQKYWDRIYIKYEDDVLSEEETE